MSNHMKQFQRRTSTRCKYKFSKPGRKLFGRQRQEVTPTSSNCHNHNTKGNSTVPIEKYADKFFTFRLKHILGGPLAQHFNEERLVLFRSDKAGAIGKIIFSSSRNNENNNGSDNEELVTARIHALEVKPAYRGHDLGGFLFTQVMNVLASSKQDNIHGKILIHGQLDAEEDTTRHNKLVQFYKSLGCHVKDSPSSSSIQYLHHQDKVFRKIPMCFDYECIPTEAKCNIESIVEDIPFLPIQFIHQNGLAAVMNSFSQSSSSSRRNYWLIYFVSQENISSDMTNSHDSSSLIVEFRTTLGQTLTVSSRGEISLIYSKKNSCIYPDKKSSSKFILHRTDVCGRKDINDAHVWSIQLLTTQDVFYLSIDQTTSELRCERTPSSWTVDQETLSLCCDSSTNENEANLIITDSNKVICKQ